MILTKEEKELIMKERNIYFVDMTEELSNFLIKECSGYKIEFLSSNMKYFEINEFKKNNNIIDVLCICGLNFSSTEYFACPVCNNHKFRNQKINFEDFIECYNEKKPLKNLKKKLFNEGYSYEKESETRYKLYREKESFTYDWLTHELKITKDKNKKLVGYIEKTKDEFYAINNNKKIHIVNFAKNLKKNKSLEFIKMYNDLNKERPLPVIECKGNELACMILDNKLRIVCEYFNVFIEIDIENIFNHQYYSGLYNSLDSYHRILDKIKESDKSSYPIDEKIYNIYSATNLPKSIISSIKKDFDEHKSNTTLRHDIFYYIKIISIYEEEPSNALRIFKYIKELKDLNHLNQFYEILRNQNHIFKHLLNYLYEIKEKQGIKSVDALNYYYDYINSSNSMGSAYTKYPKNLIKVHDIRMKDFKLVESKEKTDLFKKNYEKQKMKMNEIDNYIFKQPLEPVDLTIEGQNLNHCVASYVDRVVNNNSLIYFMRDKSAPNISLITIEYSRALNRIVQVRGRFNRRPTEEENEAVKKWAASNKIKY